MATRNPITGDLIQTKPSSSYADNFDNIFRKKSETEEVDVGDLDEALRELEAIIESRREKVK